ncbi:MAG: winged-helix domain-containing protein, partial [Nitrososphaerales archaeon]
PIMLPPDPAVADEMERTKTIVYNLTPLALEYLQMRVEPSKMGDAKHARVVEKLLKQDYWPMGYFTVVDWGEGSGGKPDIAVLKPCVREIKDKEGNELRMPSPYDWDYSSVLAVEVEMAPQKNKEQVLKNYHKNVSFYTSIRFVVTSDTNAQQLREILAENPKVDSQKFRIDKIDFETLNSVEPAKNEEVAGQQEQPQQSLGRAEEVVLSLVVAGWYSSREELAKKCEDVGLEVSERSVSRYLKELTDRGLLRRVGNGYEPTELSRKLTGQDTL